MDQHFMAIKHPAPGLIFEDGLFVSKERLQRDLIDRDFSDTELKFYMAGLSVFKDKGFMVYDG